MKWINAISKEYAVDNISVFIWLSFLPFSILLLYIYIKVGNITLGLGLNFFYFLIYVYMARKETIALENTKHWLSLEANVISVQIVNLFCILWKTRRPYYPKIQYAYEIDEQKYVSDKVFLKTCSRLDSEQEAKSLAKKLIHDNKVRCYVNPDNHSQSILVRETQVKPEYFLMALMMFFISFIFIASDVIK